MRTCRFLLMFLTCVWVTNASLSSISFAATQRIRSPRPDRTVFVHLFEWQWKDVARECETFLGPKGFAAVQVSPPNEHAILPKQPWYQRYQPVSFQLTSRSGTRAEFIDMVQRCKAVGVDIYVDAVLNHMSWVNRSGQTQFGNAGTPYDEYSYGNIFRPADFHRCGRYGDDSIREYQDRWEVQNCNLTTCADLKTESEHVRGVLAAYLDDLTNIGVAGFRIDAAKHIPSYDLQAIFGKTRRNFYAYQEVIDYGSEPIRSEEYFQTGDVSEFKYARNIAHVFNSEKLAYLQNFGSNWGFIPGYKAVVFLDNHDLQRGHGGGGEALTHKDGQRYALASVFMLAWPYGYPQVMSSYRFSDPSAGPPAFADGRTKPVFVNGASTCGGQDWLCEHRWTAIANMVAFRNYTQIAGDNVSKWWSNDNNAIAFARGNRGYVVINNENRVLNRWFDTGLPPGEYCDVISGSPAKKSNRCSGRSIKVNNQGWAEIQVNPYSAAAIHGGARITF